LNLLEYVDDYLDENIRVLPRFVLLDVHEDHTRTLGLGSALKYGESRGLTDTSTTGDEVVYA
jgi:hypothetical protein